MLKNIRKVVILLIIYLLSLMLFELIFGAMRFNENLVYISQHNFSGPLVSLAIFVEAGVYHFIFVSILAICTIFNKKISNITKNTIYIFPFLTIILTWPMMTPTIMLANLMHIPFNTI